MQLRHLSTLLQPNGSNGEPIKGPCKITAICWSLNNRKLAVCGSDRVVTLFDEHGERKDRFATKAAEKDTKGPKTYIVRDIQFSPDATKLATAQSDNIVYVYRIGNEWGDKKSICNKFHQTSSITSMTWPSGQPNELVYGLADGKVKVGQLRSNKPATLYTTDSYVTALASNLEGNAIISAHMDGSIWRYVFENEEDALMGGVNGGGSAGLFAHHPCVPFALSWGQSIVAAGNDCQVFFYDNYGGIERSFMYPNDGSDCKEFTCATFNPTGETAVVGNYNSFYIYALDPKSESWEEVGIKRIENLYSVTALSWKADGSRLALGSSCGVVDLYDACIKRVRYKSKFEFTYVSLSQVIVKKLGVGSRFMVKSQFGCEITKIHINMDRYVIAHTTSTLLLGDLETYKLTEVPWQSVGTEKFIQDNANVCLVYLSGELSLIEYGSNEILGAIRTDQISPHLISVRINEKPKRRIGGQSVDKGNRGTPEEYNNKVIAYLLDSMTITIKDLVSQASSTVSHDSAIDFLELNARGDLLLFRDKRRQLHLYEMGESQTRHTLLSYCTYAQWVPESDVVVAQNRSNLCVWYNIRAPDQVTVHNIRGDIEDIERSQGRTEVIVDEGISAASYLLDEAPIEFGTAIDDGNFKYAEEILESLEITPEAEAMWSQLGTIAFDSGDLYVAERCAAALGDVSRCRFIRKMIKLANRLGRDMGGTVENGIDHWAVRSRLALLSKDVKTAESILLSQGRNKEAVDMFMLLHRYEEAINVATNRGYSTSEIENMKEECMTLLLNTGQEERAAGLLETEGEYKKAIDMYLSGGLPGRAAAVVIKQNITQPSHMLDNIASALSKAGMYEKAGDFYERLDQSQKSLDSYLKGGSYRKAVELARRYFPSQVVPLQEAWGDYLVQQRQVDMAINHYIEANAHTKAIEAALSSRQWSRAMMLATSLDQETAKPYYRQLGHHYEECKQLDEAEKCYVNADCPNLAVEMYTKIGKWEIAHKLAMTYMSKDEVSRLYLDTANKMEAQGKLRDAERLYIMQDAPDLAINMYKKLKKYDAMIRLVSTHRQELLKETYQYLGQQLQMEGNFKEAETYYCEAGEWLSAVNMWRSNDMWEEAMRVAKVHGGAAASKRVAFAWALALGSDGGIKLLTRLNLVEPAISYYIDTHAYEHAMELASSCMPRLVPEVHFKYALYLEDEGRFKEAEEEFLKAQKPREAVDMYIHQLDWDAALRVAENNDPAAIGDVLVAKGRNFVERGEMNRAEELFLSASKPELALTMYVESSMWSEAIRVAQRYLPHRVPEIESAQRGSGGASGGKVAVLNTGRAFEDASQWGKALDCYLKASFEQLGHSPEDAEEVWYRAVRVARGHLVEHYRDTAREVGRRLMDVGRYESSCTVYLQADFNDLAVEAAIRGGCWDRAREAAAGRRNLLQQVEEAHQSQLIKGEKSDVLMELGHTGAALDILATRGEWERLWEVAKKDKTPSHVLAKYTALHVTSLLEECNTKNTGSSSSNILNTGINNMFKHGIPMFQNGKNKYMYTELVRRVLGRSMEDEKEIDESEQLESVMNLRSILFTLHSKLSKSSIDHGGNSKDADEDEDRMISDLEELLMAVHYYSVFLKCSMVNELQELAAKAAITLLRFNSLMPSDKAFYIAGSACRTADHKNLAFVLLNHYVDLADAIEESNPSLIDNSDLASATRIPLSSKLPEGQYIEDETFREDEKTWVLSLCTDKSIDQELPPANRAAGTIYEGLFKSHYRDCIVTGYPVAGKDILEVNGVVANRRDWNTFVQSQKICPWSQQAHSPMY